MRSCHRVPASRCAAAACCRLSPQQHCHGRREQSGSKLPHSIEQIRTLPSLGLVLIKPVAKSVDFMPYSATFWQNMAEFSAILHKKGGLKMGSFSDKQLRLVGNTVSKSFKLSKHSPLSSATWLTTLVESADRRRRVSAAGKTQKSGPTLAEDLVSKSF